MNSIYMRYPKGLAKCLTLSYDDGVDQDRRLIELMKKHGIAGTFNISAGKFAPEDRVYEAGRVHRPMTEKACIDAYSGSELIEVATHGFEHPFLDRLPTPEAVWQVISDRRGLEKTFGKIIRGHAYPFGTYNDEVVKILESCGIVYARTTKATLKFDMPENWLILHPTCHHKHPELMALADKFLGLNVAAAPQMFYLWGHTFEFESDDNWDVIEKFFDKMAGREDIWYATNIQVYEYTKAYESLIYSANCDTVYNPTQTDVWVSKNRKPDSILIPAGQTVKLNG